MFKKLIDIFDKKMDKPCAKLNKFSNYLENKYPIIHNCREKISYTLKPIIKKNIIELAYINISITCFALFAIFNSFTNLVQSTFFLQTFLVNLLLCIALILDLDKANNLN